MFISGGVFSIFVGQGCAVFQGVVFVYFFNREAPKEGKFPGAVCRNMLKGGTLLVQVPFFAFRSIFTDFF